MAYKQKWVRVATQDADKRGRASARPLVNCRSASIRVAVPAWLFSADLGNHRFGSGIAWVGRISGVGLDDDFVHGVARVTPGRGQPARNPRHPLGNVGTPTRLASSTA